MSSSTSGLGTEIVGVINKLQDSSGKSSVLEKHLGRDFLPRGTGIVTRRPLVLPFSKFYDFNKIRDEIVRIRKRRQARMQAFPPKPIKPSHIPEYIEKQIREMLLKYISKPACIILAVTAANTDLANSDGLKMAREVDPEGTRTIGVLTKVDLMQRDIETNKPISALEFEREYFENHPSYKGKAQFCGTPFLARKLNMILMHHIRATLPDIKARISQQLWHIVLSVITEFTNEFRLTIDGNTNDLSLNELSGGARISFVFHELFNNGIKSIDPFDQVKDGEIRTMLYNSSGSTPALFVIVKQQIKRLEDPSLKCCQLVYDELIRILGQLLTKVQAFRRYPALKERFNAVVVNFFKQAMNPTMKLVTDMVAMQACYVNTTHPDFIGGHKATAIVPNVLVPANLHLPVLIPRNPKFLRIVLCPKTGPKKKGVAAMEAPPPSIRPQNALNERETMETEVTKLLIHSYFNIIKREMIDMVPKAISLTLVSFSKENLQRELLQELYKPDVLDELLKESDFVVSRRKEVQTWIVAGV
ncbi:Dynamin central region-domain-containing protein [Gymnopilus junonius]|uniref:Dynamin central region-domain-containing protein n=1 Tax=Gymnopilus junonius TaxID=109634 RepID=A0A9P5P187_GYMJU|nr:Dynamin central region-domain-containing protein [Gymnopilus junonius]